MKMRNDWLTKRIRPSSIDTYVQYRSGYHWNGVNEYTTDEFVRYLAGVGQKTSYHLTMGTALHKLFELSPYGTLPEYIIVDGVHISCHPDFDATIYRPTQLEVPVSGVINGLLIKGTCDAKDSHAVYDWKTTKSFSIETYTLSWQWRVYLYLTGLNKFVYNVFTANKNEASNSIELKKLDVVTCYRYPDMNKDVENIVNEYWHCLLRLKPEIERIAKIYGINLDKSPLNKKCIKCNQLFETNIEHLDICKKCETNKIKITDEIKALFPTVKDVLYFDNKDSATKLEAAINNNFVGIDDLGLMRALKWIKDNLK
jgi:hypothetical protein